MTPHTIPLARRATYRASLRGADFLTLRHLEEYIRSRLTRLIRSGADVVDIGCGEQPLRSVVESAGGRYAGVDVQQNRSGTVDVIAPIWKLPLGDSSADVVIATEVIEHVSDVDGGFRELARILRPGGTILLTTPFAYPLHEEPHDYGRLTENGLRWFAERHGLQVVELSTLGNEIEAMTVVWTNLWERLPRGSGRLRRKAFTLFRIALNVVSNAIGLALSGSFGGVLPRKTYLSLAAVLAKRT